MPLSEYKRTELARLLVRSLAPSLVLDECVQSEKERLQESVVKERFSWKHCLYPAARGGLCQQTKVKFVLRCASVIFGLILQD